MNTLTEMLERSVSDHPDRTAVTMRLGVRSIKYNYAKLEERAHAYAKFMREQHVGKGDRVVIWAANQPDWVAAMFGSYLNGSVVVPLDVRSSRDFVERVITQTEPSIAFAGKTQSDVLRELEIPTHVLETMNLPVNGRVVPEPISADDLAEVIFTSGTTGDPKGVMLTHGNIVTNVRAGIAVIPIGRDTRMLSLLPLSHMFEQVGGCFAPIYVGAAVCSARPPTRRRPRPATRSPRSSTSRSASTGSRPPSTCPSAASRAVGPACAASRPTGRRSPDSTRVPLASPGWRARAATASRRHRHSGRCRRR